MILFSMFSERPLGFIVGFVACSALILTGCSDNSNSPRPEPEIGSVQVVTQPDSVERPIFSYLPTPAELIRLANLQISAVNACYAENGVVQDFSAGVSNDQLDAFIAEGVRNRVIRSELWGFFDTSSTSSNGYRYTGQASLRLEQGGANDQIFEKCTQKAAEVVRSKTGFIAYLEPAVLPNGGPEVPLSDSRFIEAASAWSKCMAGRGFSYLTPVAAVSDQKWRSGASPSPEEISVATADLACKSETNLVGIALAVQSAYDQKYIDENSEQLAVFRDKVAAMAKQ